MIKIEFTNSNAKWWLVGLALAAILLACSNPTPAAPKRDLQEAVHYYLFDTQPMSGEQFVKWANKHLANYSSRKVYKALYTEGKLQAKKGHPNAVGVLSFMAKAWADEKGLEYKRNFWIDLQEEAKSNLRDDPGEIKLWPSKK